MTDCINKWCAEKVPVHSFHQGVITSAYGVDPHEDISRSLQLVIFGSSPDLHNPLAAPELGLTITGPDMMQLSTRPDRLSIALGFHTWDQVQQDIAGALTKIRNAAISL